LAFINTHSDNGETRDEKLVAMAKEGNTVAFGMLIQQHELYITRVVSRFLFRPEDSREVVQDTFVRVWQHLGDFDGRCRFTTWIYSIAFNLSLDRMKAIKRRREFTLPVGFEQLAGKNEEFSDPAERADNGAIGRAVRSFASELSKVQRLVFVLRDLQDLTVEEVCRVTGFSTDKVKSNLYYARKFMRGKLLKGGYL
jgi:RNA polymerase sigma-70 factor (ECF subfamily)